MKTGSSTATCSQPGETDRQVVAAVAAASFNSAWPEGYGWELWDPTVEVGVDNVRDVLPEVFRFPTTVEGSPPKNRRGQH